MPLPVRRRNGGAQTRPVQRYEPFRELEDIQEHLSELLRSTWPAPLDEAVRPWVPPVDIEETEDEWILEAELPGVDKKDINVDVEGDELTIDGEIKVRERKGILRRRSRPVGRFELRVRVPGPLDPEGVDAKVSHGVLTVRIPKPQESKAQRVEVQSGA